MAKKSWNKKVAYQAFCQEQVKQGFINQANGTWAKAVDKWTDKHMIAGYKLGGGKKRLKK